MISANNVTVRFGKRALFNEATIKFTSGNCYGLIGANGAGKSTFLKVLSGELEPSEGHVAITPGERLAVLRQDHFVFDDNKVLDVVIMGHDTLYKLMSERDELYAKPDFNDDDGIRAADIENELAELNVWEAESEAGSLLNGLGVQDEFHDKQMKDLEAGQKVRVLLAQALFGNPDILLLDEPTNNLDIESISWLEDFLFNFKNTVVVVSHDRHFLNQVCTHIADIDYAKIQLYVGNYEFWYTASQLALQQRQDKNKKVEDKRNELKTFIQRFSSNASKARQATSRKKLLEKLNLEDMPLSSRKPPYIVFKPERECGKIILEVENINKTIDGEVLLKDFNLIVSQGDKIAFVGPNDLARTTLFQIINGEMEPDSGEYRFGATIKPAYFPKENSEYFNTELNMIEWLRQYSPNEEENFVRGFLGKMLFSGDETLKKTNVLSGGEKVRCMLSRMMLSSGNCLILDEPTNHLDLESITSLNNGLIDYSEVILFSSHDHEFVQTIANRIIEITPEGIIDERMPFDDYLASEKVKEQRKALYHGETSFSL